MTNPNSSIEIHYNASGCNSRQEVELACGVGIEEKNISENQLNIYPNPSSDNITIETPIKGHLYILNLNGQELIQQQITEPKTQVDISTLLSGFYFIRLTSEKTVQVGRFIKQ